MCGLRTCPLAERDPQQFLDPRTDTESLAREKLRTRTDADPVPSVSLARILLVAAKRHQEAMINLDVAEARYYRAVT